MIEHETHRMELVATHPTGAEEWICLTCGRRLLLELYPTFKKVVLEPGDIEAAHSGSRGGLTIGPVQIEPAAAEVPSTDETATGDDPHGLGDDGPDEAEGEIPPSMEPWLRALKQIERDDL